MNEMNNNVNMPELNTENVQEPVNMEQNAVNIQDPVNMDNNMNNKPKKSRKGLIVIIILLIIIGLGVFIYMNKDVLFNNANNNNANENNVNENQNTNENINVESKEEVLTDTGLVKNITNKMNILLATKTYDRGSDYDDYFDNKAIFKNLRISDDHKLLLVLRSQPTNYISISKEQVSNSQIKSALNSYSSNDVFFNSLRQISVEKVEMEYKSLFNSSNIKHHDFIFQDQVEIACPNYFYDSTNNLYLIESSCFGKPSDESITYINKITQKDDVIYVYVSYGLLDNNKLFSDIGKKEVAVEVSNTYDVYSKKLINSTNYDKFSEYKFTFTKDGNDYYYKSIERTK